MLLDMARDAGIQYQDVDAVASVMGKYRGFIYNLKTAAGLRRVIDHIYKV